MPLISMVGREEKGVNKLPERFTTDYGVTCKEGWHVSVLIFSAMVRRSEVERWERAAGRQGACPRGSGAAAPCFWHLPTATLSRYLALPQCRHPFSSHHPYVLGVRPPSLPCHPMTPSHATVITPVPTPMQVGASNELPESEELDALYDRFLVRRQVRQILYGNGCTTRRGEG